MALELPFGIKPVNPVPVEFYSGPYSGDSLQEAINAANSGIPTAVRFPTMEANLIVAGSGAKYWYNSGIGDEFLSPLVVASSGNGNGGSSTVDVSTFNGNTTLTGSEDVVICDCSFSPITITLPAAGGFTGKTFVVKKKDSTGNTVTINTQLNQTIDGSLTRLIYSQYESMTFVCDGSEWFII